MPIPPAPPPSIPFDLVDAAMNTARVRLNDYAACFDGEPAGRYATLRADHLQRRMENVSARPCRVRRSCLHGGSDSPGAANRGQHRSSDNVLRQPAVRVRWAELLHDAIRECFAAGLDLSAAPEGTSCRIAATLYSDVAVRQRRASSPEDDLSAVLGVEKRWTWERPGDLHAWGDYFS